MTKHDGTVSKILFKKGLTLLISLIMVISGLFIANAGADNAPGITSTRAETRAMDVNGSWNNYTPTITLFGNPTPSLWNDGVDNILLVVEITDDDFDPTSGNKTEGGNTTVVVDLSTMGLGTAVPMYDDGTNADQLAYDDKWTYNLTAGTSVAAGFYEFTFNVTDNGTLSTGGARWNNSDGHSSNSTSMWAGFVVNLTVKQINRAPVASPGSKNIAFDEDMYNNTLDLSAIFSDIDDDTLSYSLNQSGTHEVMVDLTDPTAVNFTAADNWYGEWDVMITGDDGSSAVPGAMNDTLSIHVVVSSVNDMPMINATSEWMHNSNVTLDAGEFMGKEDMLWTINAVAFDYDLFNPTPDELTFGVVNDAEIPAKMDISADGMFNFTPTNDDVGMHIVNVSVTDGTEMAYMNITLNVENTNDDPTLTKVDGTAIGGDHMVDISGAVEETLFTFTVEANEIDVGDTLTFAIAEDPGLTKVPWTATKCNFTYNATNADSIMGYVIANITLKDSTGTNIDDYVIINISVTGTNDMPMIDKIDGTTAPETKTKNMGKGKVGDMVMVQIEASDEDGEMLTCLLDGSATDVTANGTNMWDVNITLSTYGEMTFNISVEDSLTSDYIVLTFTVENATPPPPDNVKPSMTLTTESGGKVTIGKDIIIEGTWEDTDATDDASAMVIMLSLTLPDGTESPFFEMEAAADTIIEINDDGTWKLTLKTDEINETGTYTMKFKFADDDGAESDVTTFSVEIVKPAAKEEEDELTMSIGLFSYDILILVIIIVVVILVLAMMMKKKKPEEEAPPMEEVPPAAPMACTACGAEIPAGSPTCPACGTPAPIPPEAAVPMACTACGSEIPAGSPTCPACGAPAPAPAAAPPVETMCECGNMIPAGSPTCPACGRPAPAPVPPEGAMPMACPACGAEVPPGSPSCPACGTPVSPPAEQPPVEQPPAEQPPAEQPPAEAAAQMVACPTCGAQIAVGQTPCPSCGTALNWG